MDVRHSEALDACQQLKGNYTRMLQFISSGGADENSQAMRGKMMETALRLLIVAEREYRLINEDTTYVKACRRTQELQETPASLATKLLQAPPYTAEREALLDSLFYAIWTSSPLDEKTMAPVADTLVQLTETEQATLTSALTLSLVEYVDGCKISMLLRLLDSEKPVVKVRALTGIVLCAMVHTEDMELHQELIQTLTQEYLQRDDIQGILPLLNLSFLLCLQTKSAHEKMENDILPGFMKMAKDGRVNLGFNEDGEVSMDIPLEDSKERKEIRNHMKAFIDMHRDGIDMNASTMLTMRRLPFFQELTHWFLPFDKKRTEISGMMGGQDEVLSDLMGQMGKMSGSGDCDTDRYSSTIVFFQHMDPKTKQEIASAAREIKEDGLLFPGFVRVSDQTTQEDTTDMKHHCRRYMQQLYRVFHMWPTCKEWQNPFLQSANWLENPILCHALENNRKSLHTLTDFLVKYHNYQEAEAYLNRLVKLEGSDADTLRSAAYCKQQQGHFGAAITLYTQADLLCPDHSWTLAQMQLCYAQLDRHEQRLDCLLQLEQLEPENAKVISETCLCLMQLQRWQEASQRFFRLELEGRRTVPSRRAIAWCSLQQGKYEQALRYYQLLLDSTSARWQDYLNAGHATWMQGNTSQAIALYREYIKHYLTDDPKITDALTPFNADTQLLLTLGRTQHEIDLMHDILEQ